MKAEVLVLWVGVTLCCTLVCAQEDAKQNKVTGVQAQERQTLVKKRSPGEEVGVEMLDKPAEEVNEEKAKPKKKKTPEEIEEGK